MLDWGDGGTMKGLKMKEEMASAGENEIAIVSEELAGSIRLIIEQAKARSKMEMHNP